MKLRYYRPHFIHDSQQLTSTFSKFNYHMQELGSYQKSKIGSSLIYKMHQDIANKMHVATNASKN